MSTVEPDARAIPTLPRRRRWRRLARGLLGMAIVGTLVLGVLRVASLWGIPDAPEPFDVAAFEAETVTDDRNAIVLFREAERALGDQPARAFQGLPVGMKELNADWSATSPEVRAVVEKFRPALETWRRGTERPDAMPPRSQVPPHNVLIEPLSIYWLCLAQLEASRLEAAGDLEGAWAWHRARLRATLLYGRQMGVGGWGRPAMIEVFAKVTRGAADWAEHPAMTVPLLRRAIADVEAMAPLHGNEADSLKADYVSLMAEFDKYAAEPAYLAANVAQLPPTAMVSRAAGLTSRVVPPEGFRPLYARAASLVEAEPERSKRLARMLFANWLAQADRKFADRPPTVSTYPLVFDEDAGPTPSLSPSALSRRAATAPYLAIARGGFALPPSWWATLDQWPTTYRADRHARADLILSLADRIYEIEKGKPPGTVEDLVGTVLPRLPEDYDPSAGTPATPGP